MEDMKTYDSVNAAKLLLALAYEKGIVLNITKVQKILYIIYSHYLSKENRKIFSEQPQAWPYGPVFPRTRNHVDYGKVYRIDDPEIEDIRSEVNLVHNFKKAIEIYSKFSAGQLSQWSHMENSPWDRTVKQQNNKWGVPILDEYIREYFQDLEIL